VSENALRIVFESALSRRRFIELLGGMAAAASFGSLLEACTLGSGTPATPSKTLKIGYVSPETGSLAGFGEADAFVVSTMHDAFKDGLPVGSTKHPIDILVRDSQSDPNRAATVAGDLILKDNIDLMLVSSTPETTNPVSDQCELNGVPCISTVAPWQPWFLGRNGDPTKGFKWTYHFFWGLEDIIAVFEDMWTQVDTNHVVAALWPNDGDGNAWGDAKLGFPPALKASGYSIIDPGRYPDLTQDYTAQITKFRAGNAQILTGVPIPPDFTTFYKQAAQQGLKPRIASVGKALLFPSSVEALGDLGNGLSSEVWWSPSHPFKSSITGQSALQLATAYQDKTGKEWTQPIGFVHALFEVLADALKRAGTFDDKQAVVTSIKATNLDTIVGHIAWSGTPVPNVAKTPLVGGQWGPGSKYKYDLKIVSNKAFPQIPSAGTLRAIPGS
jgi:branched-chain amino acid transport system substrate-binding protein